MHKLKLNNLILHLHPRSIPGGALQYKRTLGLGGIAALLFLLLVVSGSLLRFFYVATPVHAYDSIQRLSNHYPYGAFLRNIHYWSASLLLITSFLHMLRVFFTGAYTGRRRGNWRLGVFLIAFTVIMCFTGYLLPWDQRGYWAVTVSTNLLQVVPIIGSGLKYLLVGKNGVSDFTLNNFYALHTGVLPVSMVVLLAFHFWKVRKNGGIKLPRQQPAVVKKHVPVIPNLVTRELNTALIILACVVVLAAFFNAPLGPEANKDISPNPTKAPWYFMGIQELIIHVHPFIAVVFIPAVMLVFLFKIPNWVNENDVTGNWFINERAKRHAFISALFAVVSTSTQVLVNEYFNQANSILRHGIFNLILLILLAVIYYICMHKKLKVPNGIIVQTLGVFLLVTFIVFTLVGIFLRGEGMRLIF